MEGYYIVSQPDEALVIVRREGTEADLVNLTRKTLYRVEENGEIISYENPDFVDTQVFWTREALGSELLNRFHAPPMDQYSQPLDHTEEQRRDVERMIDEATA